MDHKKISELIGEFILLFGSLESTISMAILFIVKSYYPNADKSYNKLWQFMIKDNSINKNIELIKYLVNEVVADQYQTDWNNCIHEIETLQKRRNIYAHNFYGIDGNKLIKKTKKEWTEITIEEIILYMNILNERYRQMVDSVLCRDELYISKLPKLMV